MMRFKHHMLSSERVTDFSKVRPFIWGSQLLHSIVQTDWQFLLLDLIFPFNRGKSFSGFLFVFLSFFFPFISNQGQNGLASVMTASVLGVFDSHSAFFFPREVRNGSKQYLKIILSADLCVRQRSNEQEESEE